jgi:morphogenetic protein associated with SpoVID
VKIHIVKQGDTLYALSQKYGVPLQTIIETNPQLSNPDVLEVGDKVKIPSAPVAVPGNSELFHKHTVKQGDTLWKLSKAWGILLKDIIEANPQLKNPDALKIGEIVNIPKKGVVPPVQPGQLSTFATDKTQVGGKTYTGPIEQPPAVIPEPVAEPLPPVAPAPPVEVGPVQEMVHSETQSLYVQISVPAQEVKSHYEMPPMPEILPVQMKQPAQEAKQHVNMEPVQMYQHAPVANPIYMEQPVQSYQTAPNANPIYMEQPVQMAQPSPCHCDHSAGYPGLTENPNFYDCPPSYPLYEPMPYLAMNAPYSQVQPMVYEPDCMPPYYYPYNVGPAADFPGPWHPDALYCYPEPVVAGIGQNEEYAPPQYVESIPNLPWPSCGCGSDGQIQPAQDYPNEAPVYNSISNYPNQPPISPYGMGGPQTPPQYGVSPYSQNIYESPVLSNIPPVPEYPGMGAQNFGYQNRIEELQQQTSAIEDQLQAVDTETLVTDTDQSNVRNKVTKKAASAKVRTSSKNSNASKPQRSRKNKAGAKPSKRRNPWILS